MTLGACTQSLPKGQLQKYLSADLWTFQVQADFLTLNTRTKKHYASIIANIKELTTQEKTLNNVSFKVVTSHVDAIELHWAGLWVRSLAWLAFISLNSPSSFFAPFFLEIIFHIFDICVFAPALLWFFAHSLTLRGSRHFVFLFAAERVGSVIAKHETCIQSFSHMQTREDKKQRKHKIKIFLWDWCTNWKSQHKVNLQIFLWSGEAKK